MDPIITKEYFSLYHVRAIPILVSYFKKMMAIWSTAIICSALSMVTFLLLARQYGPGGLGEIFGAIAYVLIINTITDLGLGQAHIKIMQEGRHREQCVGTFVRIKYRMISIFVLTSIGLFIGIFLLGLPFSWIPISLILVFTISTAFMDLYGVHSTILNSIGKPLSAQKPQIVDYAVRASLVPIFCVLSFPIEITCLAYIFGPLLSFLISFKDRMFRNGFMMARNLELDNLYFTRAKQLVPWAIMLFALVNIDKWFLTSLGNATQLGLYSSANSIAIVVSYFGLSYGIASFPRFASMAESGQLDAMRIDFRDNLRISTSICIFLIIAGTFLTSSIIAVILGNAFEGASLILQTLLVAFSFLSIIYQIVNFDISMGLQRFTSLSFITGLAIIVASYVAIYILLTSNLISYSSVGLASAVGMGFGFCSICISRIALDYRRDRILIPPIGALMVVFIIFLAASAISQTIWWFSILGAMLMTIVVCAMNRSFIGEFGNDLRRRLTG